MRISSCRAADQPGAWSGPYEAGAVWAVLEGSGTVTVNGRAASRPDRRCTRSSSTSATPRGSCELEVGPGLTCHGVQFEAGLA